MHLLLTADRMSVEDAHRMGFVREVLPPDKLMPRAVEIAEMIGRNAPLAVQGTKAVASFWRQLGVEESNRLNERVKRSVWGSEDAIRGAPGLRSETGTSLEGALGYRAVHRAELLPYAAVAPPSITSSMPVTQADSSEAR